MLDSHLAFFFLSANTYWIRVLCWVLGRKCHGACPYGVRPAVGDTVLIQSSRRSTHLPGASAGEETDGALTRSDGLRKSRLSREVKVGGSQVENSCASPARPEAGWAPEPVRSPSGWAAEAGGGGLWTPVPERPLAWGSLLLCEEHPHLLLADAASAKGRLGPHSVAWTPGSSSSPSRVSCGGTSTQPCQCQCMRPRPWPWRQAGPDSAGPGRCGKSSVLILKAMRSKKMEGWLPICHEPSGCWGLWKHVSNLGKFTVSVVPRFLGESGFLRTLWFSIKAASAAQERFRCLFGSWCWAWKTWLNMPLNWSEGLRFSNLCCRLCNGWSGDTLINLSVP